MKSSIFFGSAYEPYAGSTLSCFARYHENILASSIVGELLDSDSVPSLRELAERLDARASDAGPWLVSTPLANITLPELVVPLTADALLQVTHPERDRTQWDSKEQDADIELEVIRHLKDRLPRATRWLHFSTEPDPIDTRRTVALLSVEEGTVALATAKARSKAHYALAVWTTVHPPDEFEIVADSGLWVPQPFIHAPPALQG